MVKERGNEDMLVDLYHARMATQSGILILQHKCFVVLSIYIASSSSKAPFGQWYLKRTRP